MDYTGGIDPDQREDIYEAAHHPSQENPSSLRIPPQTNRIETSAPPLAATLSSLAAASTTSSAAVPAPLSTVPARPESARARPLPVGAPFNPSALPNPSDTAAHNFHAGAAPPSSNWGPPPPSSWVPSPSYPRSAPYPGAPPSYYQPPPPQPFVTFAPDRSAPWDYVWNPSPGLSNAPAGIVNSRGSIRGLGRRLGDVTRGRGTVRGGRVETQANEENGEVEEEETKSGRNRAMFPNEKLTLIRECAEHAHLYALNNREKFWGKVASLLKEKTGYSLKSPRLTVERWVKSRLDEFTQEKLGFPGQGDLDDFCILVDKFGERWRAVAEEKEQLQKSQAAMFVTENLTKLHKDTDEEFDPMLLHRGLANTIEDEPMAAVDTATDLPTGRSTPSISLNGSSKRRRVEDDSYQLRETAELMVAGMKDSMGVLAEGLRQSVVATRGDSDIMGKVQALERRASDIYNGSERNNRAIGDLNERLIRVEEGVNTLLGLLAKKEGDIDDHNGDPCSGHSQ